MKKSLFSLSLLLFIGSCADRPARISPVDKGKIEKPIISRNIGEDEANPETEVNTVAPLEPAQLLPSLSYTIDSTIADPDCPLLNEINKDDNRFSFVFFPFGDAKDPGVTTEYARLCQIKGSVIVPAGYIVALDVEERIETVLLDLSDKSTASFRLAIDSVANELPSSRAYSVDVQGPATSESGVPVPIVLNAEKDQAPIPCSLVSSANQQMSFSIAYEAKFAIDAASPSVGGGVVFSSPAFVFKFLKCADDVPQGLEPEEDGKFFYTLDVEANKISCPLLQGTQNNASDIQFTAAPFVLKAKAPESIGAVESCRLSGKAVIPAHHILKLSAQDTAVSASIFTDDQTTLNIQYRAELCTPELFGCTLKSRFESLATFGPNTAGPAPVDFKKSPVSREEDCAAAVPKTETFDLSVEYLMIKTHREDLQKLDLGQIDGMPALQFELIKCL